MLILTGAPAPLIGTCRPPDRRRYLHRVMPHCSAARSVVMIGSRGSHNLGVELGRSGGNEEGQESRMSRLGLIWRNALERSRRLAIPVPADAGQATTRWRACHLRAPACSGYRTCDGLSSIYSSLCTIDVYDPTFTPVDSAPEDTAASYSVGPLLFLAFVFVLLLKYCPRQRPSDSGYGSAS